MARNRRSPSQYQGDNSTCKNNTHTLGSKICVNTISRAGSKPAKKAQDAYHSSHSSSSLPSFVKLRLFMFRLALVLVVSVAILLGAAPLLVKLTTIDDVGVVGYESKDKVAFPMDQDDALKKIKAFLDDFVCHFKPSLEVDPTEVEGYCHPRLTSDPLQRTQRVSTSAIQTTSHISNQTHATFATLLAQELFHRRYLLVQFWQKVIAGQGHYVHDEIAITPGELIMRLPRPLQIWDLDALRDDFIRRSFLGWEHDLSERTNGNRSLRPFANHSDTENPLESGAYLTVYLLRLSQSSFQRVDENEPHMIKQCQVGEETCHTLENLSQDGQPQQKEPEDDHNDSQPRWTMPQTPKREVLLPYIDILPTYEDRLRPSSHNQPNNPHDHPLLWTNTVLESLFPKYTPTYDLIQHYKQMMESEYFALRDMSPEFGENINLTTYLGMRVNVLSRAFGVFATENDNGAFWGVPEKSKTFELNQELQLYPTSNFGEFLPNDENLNSWPDKSISGSDNLRFRSMCPLLDMYDSHPHPNVNWKYDSSSSSFLVYAPNKQGVRAGDFLIVSYGKYTEGHLFAKYGYVNGDGSSPTEASLAVFHRMLGDVGLQQQYSKLPFELWERHWKERKRLDIAAEAALEVQAKELLRYLMFDDGYTDCIRPSSPAEKDWQLKQLKFKHLQKIANLRDPWIIRLPAKHPDAQPRQPNRKLHSIDEDDTDNNSRGSRSKEGINAKHILSVCRLLSLTIDDFSGEAIESLKEWLQLATKSYFPIERQGDALEYRAMMCVVRLCNVALSRYPKPYDTIEPEAVGSKEWTAWYILDGELRVLNILRNTALTEANRLKKRKNDKAMTVREAGPCPLDYSLPLLIEI